MFLHAHRLIINTPLEKLDVNAGDPFTEHDNSFDWCVSEKVCDIYSAYNLMLEDSDLGWKTMQRDSSKLILFYFRAMAFLAIDPRLQISLYDNKGVEDEDDENLWANLLKGELLQLLWKSEPTPKFALINEKNAKGIII